MYKAIGIDTGMQLHYVFALLSILLCILRGGEKGEATKSY